jgi:hypothetical protein
MIAHCLSSSDLMLSPTLKCAKRFPWRQTAKLFQITLVDEVRLS